MTGGWSMVSKERGVVSTTVAAEEEDTRGDVDSNKKEETLDVAVAVELIIACVGSVVVEEKRREASAFANWSSPSPKA